MTTHHTMHHNGPLDVVTIGEAMAMFIARETGDPPQQKPLLNARRVLNSMWRPARLVLA